MTNRDKLLNMSLYDLIMSLNGGKHCRLQLLNEYATTERCRKFKWNCSECLQAWLNEQAKYSNKI